MSTLQEMKYKETTPDKTVKRIKEILKKNKIKVEENWIKKSSVNTYSLRLCIKGTNIGQNGKGMTKDFARASAYAEFLERYQNGMLVFRNEKPSKELPFVYSKDEKKLTIDEIIKENDSFMENLYQDNKKEYLDKKEFMKNIFGKEKEIIALPHYSVKNKKVVYIPQEISRYICGSNGMCAGNSTEEALIEGISEILERYVSMQIIYNKVSLPEIPETYIKNFPKVNYMMEKLRKNPKYTCKLLDCSLGGKYPVAGLILIQKDTGKLGFKLGAHPDYGIAMERCFTEASQGIDIFDYSQCSSLDFENKDINKDENIKEIFDSAGGTIPYNVIAKEKAYQFTQIKDISNLNNREILKGLINTIIKEGYDILIRDVSTLGFPSFRIIIPGMSEIMHSKMAGRFAEFKEIEYLLKDLKRINLNNIKRVIELMEKQIYEVGNNSFYIFMYIKDINLLPCENIAYGCKYFLAICYIMNGEYKKAEELLGNILFIAQNIIPNQSAIISLRAVYYYASAMNKFGKHGKAIYYIKMMFNEKIANTIDEQFREKEKILIKHYNIKYDDYVENDDSYYLPFMQILRKLQNTNVIEQIKLKKILE